MVSLASYWKISSSFILIQLIFNVSVRGNFFSDIGEDIVNFGRSIKAAVKKKITCAGCKGIMEDVIKHHKEGESNEVLIEDLTGICDSLNVQKKQVCEGTVRLNLPLLLDIIDEKNLNAETVCKTILEPQNCYGGGPAVPWSVDLSAYGPTPTTCPEIKKNTLNAECKKLVHITDTHWDQKYTVDSTRKCGEPICCRNANEKPKKNKYKCGEYGSYGNCDVPLKTLDSALKNIKEKHGSEICAMYFTGDLVEHNVWETTVEQVKTSIITQTDLIKKYLPDTPFYVAVGNHDMHPTNQFADPQKSNYTNWQYELMVEQWTQYLDDDARATIRKGGYYSYMTKNGIRIISLNSMFCYVLNWWTIHDPRDIAGQLAWLAKELSNAEKNGEVVHIMQHITVGDDDCLREYSRELWRILTRFHCNIKGFFAGHLHVDETRVIYDIDTLKTPIISVFNGGSITTFEDTNPNYKIYELDTGTMEVLNAQCWILDLTKIPGVVEWTQLYSFIEAFQIESMKPAELDKLVHKLATDKKLMEQYNSYYSKGAKTGLVEDCDDKCLTTRFCDIVTTNYANTAKCKSIKEETKR